MSYQVDKNIPIAPINTESRSKYPTSQLEIGDSFAVPKMTNKTRNQVAANVRIFFNSGRP